LSTRLRGPYSPTPTSSRSAVGLSYFVMSGNDDFLLHVAVADNDRLSSFILDWLTQRREIVHVRTSVIFSHVRRSTVVPLPAREDLI
jgi:DNA-binding Lrp family transcriptional regulator